MQKILRNGSVLTYSTVKPPCIAQIQRRCVSRNTAIHRGLRQGVAAAYEDRSERPWEKRTRTWERANRTEEQPGPWEKPRIENPRTWEKRPYQREHDDHGRAHIRRQESDSQSGDGEPRSYRKHEEDSPLGFNNPETTSRPSNGRKRRVERTPRPPAKSRSYDEPVSIPYTTAASEFLYGYNPVCAALKAQRRKLYKIYLHPRVASRDGDAEVASIRRLAEKAKVEIVDVNDGWLKVMDKMSDDRPHNGCVLEVSPLPRLPVMALGIIQTGENGEDQFHLQLETQSREQLEINGGTPWLPYKSDRWRSPFILLIDDVLNPGNLGAIIRSAYFLGVDAIAISTRTCAPLNSEAVKASAGAIEAIPILAVHDVETFLRNSAVDARWKLYCATTPGPELSLFASEQGSLKFTKMKNSRYQQLGERHQCTFNSPLGQGEPVILAIGGEQRGLSRSVTKNAFAFVQIMPGINALDVGVDSLNVSAASAILCAEFMRSSPASLTRPTSVARPTRGRDMDASYSGWKAEGAMNDLNKRCKMESDRR